MIGKNIKRLRREHGYSQEQLARKLNVTQGAVSHWENNMTMPEASQLLALAKIFDVPLDSFTDSTNYRELDNIIPIKRSAIPIVGDIACGTLATAEENIEGFTDLPDGIHADFALRCKGDSMSPTFIDGDIVLIRQQPEVENGQIAAIGIDGESTLKHVYFHNDGISLTAENPKYSPIFIPADTDKKIIIYGLAIGYTRLF